MIWLKWYSSLSQLIVLLWELARPFRGRKERFLWNLSNNNFKQEIFSFQSPNLVAAETVRNATLGEFSAHAQCLKSIEVILFLPLSFLPPPLSNELEIIQITAWFDSKHVLGTSAKWEKQNFPLRCPPRAPLGGVRLTRPAVGRGQTFIFKQQERSIPVPWLTRSLLPVFPVTPLCEREMP